MRSAHRAACCSRASTATSGLQTRIAGGLIHRPTTKGSNRSPRCAGLTHREEDRFMFQSFAFIAFLAEAKPGPTAVVVGAGGGVLGLLWYLLQNLKPK